MNENTNTQLVIRPEESMSVETTRPQSIEELVGHVGLVHEVTKKVMKRGLHYGEIPGCGDKPTLLQPGAQVLSLTFRLCPDYEQEIVELPQAHREYRITCRLLNQNGQFLGSGVGSCSTMESKWRYRSEATGQPVPPEYWTHRDQELLGGPSYFPRKVKGSWEIYHRVEHDNPADYYNTCLKMAKKRAFVDAILTRTAAADCFTQDMEDVKENIQAATAQNANEEVERRTAPKAVEKPRIATPNATTTPQGDCIVVDVKTVNSKPGAPKPWTIWFVTFQRPDDSTFEACTFDESIGRAAIQYEDSGDVVEVVTKPGRKPGSTELVSIEVHDDIPI